MVYSTQKGLICFALMLFSYGVWAQSEKNQLQEEGKILLAKSKTTATYDSSVYYLQEALNRFQTIEDRPNILSCYNKLSSAYYNKKNYLAYQEYALHAWEYAQAYFDKKDPAYSSALGNLPGYFLLNEDYSKALELLKKNLELKEQDSPAINQAFSANNVGYIYHHHISDFERALQYYSKAVRLFAEAGPGNQKYVAYLNSNIADCLKEKQLYDSAYIVSKKTLDLLAPLKEENFNQRTKWYCYQNMAAVCLKKGQRDRCLHYAQEALKLVETCKIISDPQMTYEIFGDYYLEEKKYAQAISYFEKAAALTKANPEINKPVNTACRLAKVLSITKKFRASLDTLQGALQLLSPDFSQKENYHNPAAITILHKKSGLEVFEIKGDVFYQKYQAEKDPKDLQAALESFQLASQIIGIIRQAYAEDVSKYLLAEKAISIYEKAIEVAQKLYQLSGDKQYLADAFVFAEKNKSILLLESIRQNTAMGFDNLPDSLLQQEKTLKGEVTFLDKLIYLEKQKKEQPDTKEALGQLNNKLFEAKENYQDLIDYLENNFPKYHELKYRPQIATVEKIQTKLVDSKTALLEYFVGEHHLFLFCISSKDIALISLPKDKELVERFSILQEIWSTPPNNKNYTTHLELFNQQAPYLYEQLLKPGLAKLAPSIEKLILIPDDFLNYLPFEVLSAGQDSARAPGFSLDRQKYVLEDFQVSYNFSASLLLQNHHKQYKTTKTFAGFAPSFKEESYADTRTCDNGELFRLQFNSDEVQSISDLMEGDAFINEAASKEQFTQLEDQYDILHLATHACLDQGNPKFNRIYFSDTYLSNFDLANLSLRTNLVVLSACNTSSGTLIKGDGVMSLSRGFTLAGCPSTLTSLWAVDDGSTSELMVYFYQHLKAGKSKDQALQAAKMDYLHKADKAASHPYFWAPFLQFGNTKTLGQKSNYWYLGIGALVLLLLLIRSRWTT